MRTERHILLQSWKLIVADRVCSWRSFFWTFFWDLNLFGLVLQHPTAQDTGGAIAHPLARRLSNVSGKNNARDWWRSFKDGPDSQIACVLDSFFLHMSYIVTRCFLYYPVVSFFPDLWTVGYFWFYIWSIGIQPCVYLLRYGVSWGQNI